MLYVRSCFKLANLDEFEEKTARVEKVGKDMHDAEKKCLEEKTMRCANFVVRNATNDFATFDLTCVSRGGPLPLTVSSGNLANLPMESFRKG